MARRATCARTTGRSSWRAAILRWLQAAQIETAFIDPGKPWQNGTDESFNGKFRDQHLSLQWFRNRVDAKVEHRAVAPALQRGAAALESRVLDAGRVQSETSCRID